MRKQLFRVVSVAAIAGLVGLAAACDGGDGDDDDDIIVPDSGIPDSGIPDGGVPDGGSPGDGGSPDAQDYCPAPEDGSGNADFASAVSVTIDDPLGATGRIAEPLDEGVFEFDTTEGTWLRIATDANPTDSLDEVDTVIRLYDAAMTMVAQNDDAVPRINTDSEVIIRIPNTGTYYIEVLEYSEWAGDTAEGEDTALFDYTVRVATIDPTAMGVLEEAEAGDDAASAADAKVDNNAGLIVGDFRDNADVDVYRLAVGTLTAPLMLSSAVAPSCAGGYGSTASAGMVYVTNEAGTDIIARIDATTGAFQVSPPVLPNTSYLVWIEHSGEAAGPNDFYVYKFSLNTGNPPEAETGSGQNDTTLTAESLTNQAGSHFILANIQDGGDVDYFKFTATAGGTISVACVGQTVGSGVRGFTAQIRDQDDSVLATQLEPVAETLSIQDVSASYTGDYYLRLTKSSQDSEVTGRFARCGVHLQ